MPVHEDLGHYFRVVQQLPGEQLPAPDFGRILGLLKGVHIDALPFDHADFPLNIYELAARPDRARAADSIGLVAHEGSLYFGIFRRDGSAMIAQMGEMDACMTAREMDYLASESGR